MRDEPLKPALVDEAFPSKKSDEIWSKGAFT